MIRYLVDEDLPLSLARALNESGSGSATHVITEGLRGKSDQAVFQHALSRGLTIVSKDLGFANILRFPLGSHHGIVVARFPDELASIAVNTAIVKALKGLGEGDMEGNLVILEPGKIRLRRKL